MRPALQARGGWLVKKGVKTVCRTGHPRGASLGPHRNARRSNSPPEYRKATGREAIEDFPEWNPAHKALLVAGIPTIENVGADDTGKCCTFQGFRSA